MISPTPEQLDVLNPAQRACWALADFWNRRVQWHTRLHNSTIMIWLTALAIARRIRFEGIDNFRALDMDRGILVIANHRSFFDFFVIFRTLVVHTDIPMRILFPVRANFFYENALGPVVNLAMSGMAMFPPILRGKGVAPWNTYAVDRLRAELEDGAVVAMHPEGQRHRDEDPFVVKRFKSGAARLALQCPDVQVVPVFVTGLTNNVLEELRRTWVEPDRYPVFITYGEELCFADAREESNERRALRVANDRCRDAIVGLADQTREHARQLGAELVANA